MTESGLDMGSLPVPSELTIAQAAKILGMPEVCLDELLDRDGLEFRQEGNCRLIQRDSLLAFEEEYREQGEALDDIVRWSQEMGFYD
jgi:hypothetical protein